MSSGIGREDVEQAIWLSGIRDRSAVSKLMRVIDGYVYHASRAVAANELARMMPEVATTARKRTYKCTGDCGQYKVLEEFPERKQLNPRLPSPCSYCDDRLVRLEDTGRNRNRSLSFHDEKIG